MEPIGTCECGAPAYYEIREHYGYEEGEIITFDPPILQCEECAK